MSECVCESADTTKTERPEEIRTSRWTVGATTPGSPGAVTPVGAR